MRWLALVAVVGLVGCVDSRGELEPFCEGDPGAYRTTCGADGWLALCVIGQPRTVCNEEGECVVLDDSGGAGFGTCDQSTGLLSCADGRQPVCYDTDSEPTE
jgi:hypothetical protein